MRCLDRAGAQWPLWHPAGTEGCCAALQRRSVSTHPDAIRLLIDPPGPARPRVPDGCAYHGPRRRPEPPARTWSSGTPAADKPGDETGGRHHLYQNLGSSTWPPSPGCCARRAVGHSTGATTRPPPWSAMPSTRRPAAALPGRIRTPSRPAQSAQLRTALGPPGEPQHPPSGGQGRGALGRVPGQSRSTPRRATRGPIRWCIPPGILPYGSRWNTTRSYSTPPWGTE